MSPATSIKDGIGRRTLGFERPGPRITTSSCIVFDVVPQAIEGLEQGHASTAEQIVEVGVPVLIQGHGLAVGSSAILGLGRLPES